MITPLEIENKEFSKAMRGYNAEEVDEFLDRIILDMQQLLSEKEKLEAEIEELKKELNQYKRSETSVLNTLESAKKLMNDISESAEKRAEVIIKNAQLDAETIQREARESVSRLTDEGQRLKGKVQRFRERYRQILEDELNQLEGSSEELLADLEGNFTPASMTERLPSADRPEPEPKKESSAVSQRASMADTVVVKEKSLEEILMEDFGVSEDGPEKTRVKEDLSKTRIV